MYVRLSVIWRRRTACEDAETEKTLTVKLHFTLLLCLYGECVVTKWGGRQEESKDRVTSALFLCTALMRYSGSEWSQPNHHTAVSTEGSSPSSLPAWPRDLNQPSPHRLPSAPAVMMTEPLSVSQKEASQQAESVGLQHRQPSRCSRFSPEARNTFKWVVSTARQQTSTVNGAVYDPCSGEFTGITIIRHKRCSPPI